MAEKKSIAALLSGAIESSGVAEVVRCSESENAVKVLYRVFEKQVWLHFLEFVLSRAQGWSAHVCQQYFMRGGRLVYGWNFILQAEDIEEAAKHVHYLILKAAEVVPKNIARSLDSYPLMGASPRRTAKIAFDPRLPGPGKGGPSHKGAYSIQAGD